MLLLLLLPACVDGGAGEGSIDDLPDLFITEELRIGSVDDPQAGFTRIGSVDVDEEGNLFVLEGSVPEVRVYDPDGAFLRRFGRRGAGPGEFESAVAFGVERDAVWLFDIRHRRLTIFNRSGELVSTAPLAEAVVPLTGGNGFLYPHRMRADGTLTWRVGAVGYGQPNPQLVSSPNELIPVPVARFSTSGEVLDTIGWIERPPPGIWRPASEERGMPRGVEVGGRQHMLPEPPFDWVELVQLSDGYVVVERPTPQARNDGHIVATRIGFSGDTLYRRELRYTPIRYTASELDSIAVAAARGEGFPIAAMGGSATEEVDDAVVNRIRAAMDYPEFQQPIEEALAGEDGSLWIGFRPVLADTVTWIVLDPDGEPRGRLELPRRVRILWHSGDVIHASVPDDFDVPWLVRYRLTDY